MLYFFSNFLYTLEHTMENKEFLNLNLNLKQLLYQLRVGYQIHQASGDMRALKKVQVPQTEGYLGIKTIKPRQLLGFS